MTQKEQTLLERMTKKWNSYMDYAKKSPWDAEVSKEDLEELGLRALPIDEWVNCSPYNWRYDNEFYNGSARAEKIMAKVSSEFQRNK